MNIWNRALSFLCALVLLAFEPRPCDAEELLALLTVKKGALDTIRSQVWRCGGKIHVDLEESFLGFVAKHKLIVEIDQPTLEALEKGSGARRIYTIAGVVQYSSSGSIYEDGTDFSTQIDVVGVPPTTALAVLSRVQLDPWGYLEESSPDRFAKHDRFDQIHRSARAEFWLRTADEKVTLFKKKLR